MNKGTTKRKIISFLILLAFFFQAFAPLTTQAAELNWNNPNSGDNPYKPTVSSFLNPQLLSQVVGCTGIVNKVSEKVLGAVKKVANKLLDKAKKKVQDWAKKQLAKQTKNIVSTVITGVIQTALGATTTTALGTGTQLGTGAGKGIENISNRNVTEEHSSDEGTQAQVSQQTEQQQVQATEQTKRETKRDYKTDCLEGIAIRLAKNQLTAMTKSTMNWVNSGFNGDSAYVKDVHKLMDDITDQILKQETNYFTGLESKLQYPYGKDFARDAITSAQSGKNFQDSIKQDLTTYLEPGATIDDFSNDFSKGGWGAWNALTQREKNNPLGFTVIASQKIGNEQARAVQEKTDEVNRNQGYQDQRKCVEYAKPTNPDAASSSQQQKCIKYETTLPGSNIFDKVNTYINSPERQLELVKTMNDALNALFAALIGKLENEGLAGLSSSNALTTEVANGGFTPYITFDDDGYVMVDDPTLTISGGTTSTTGGTLVLSNAPGGTGIILGPDTDETTTGSGNGGTAGPTATSTPSGAPYIQDDGFDITKDLGNTYDADGKLIKKGVIQVQYDYVDLMGVYRSVIADVLPALGELDYCIPGPNPNWRDNSKEAIDTYLESLSAITDNVNTGPQIYYAPEGTYEYPQPVPEIPPEKKVGLLKRISLIVNPIAGMHYSRKKFQSFLDRRKAEQERAAIEADNERIRIKNEQIRSDMLAGRRPLDPIFIANTTGTDRDTILRMMAPENALDATKLLVTMEAFEEYIKENYGPDSPMQAYWKGNTRYLQMSSEGLTLTKDIPDYIDKVAEAKADSRDLLAEATPNLDKLKAIQKRVNEIIAAAQARRDQKIKQSGGTPITKLCLTKEKATYVDYNGKVITADTKPLPILKGIKETIQDYGGFVKQ